MSSIVLELQNELLNPECDIVSALRKAHVIARKLKLNEFDEWILNELNGYTDFDSVPDYRRIRGQLKANTPYRGWVPIIIPDEEAEENLCTRPFNGSISVLIQLCDASETNYLISRFNGETMYNLFHKITQYDVAVFTPTSTVIAIVDRVKNCLLEWTIRLEEEGILGENIQFNEKELSSAKNIPSHVYNYCNVTNGSISNSQIANGESLSSATITNTNGINIAEIDNIIKVIIENSSSIDKNTTETILSSVEMIREEICKPTPKKMIISNGLKLLGTTLTIANAAPVLAENIQKLIEYLNPFLSNLKH